SHARFHRADGLAVGVTGFHAGADQPGPDSGELLDPGTEKIDALTTGDLGVEPELLSDLADRDELIRGDLTAWHAGNYRVAPIALQVGQEMVVGVLQAGLLAVEDVAGPNRSQDRCHCRLAHVAPAASAPPGQQFGEAANVP